MIDLQGKGCDALRAMIASAGHWLVNEDGIETSSDDKAVQAIVDAFTLEACIEGKLFELAAHAKKLRDSLTVGVSAFEMSQWPVKLAETKAASKPLLEKEAQARGIPVSELVAKVEANAQEFGDIEAAIAGVQGKHLDSIRSLRDFGAVNDYDLTTGWPEA